MLITGLQRAIKALESKKKNTTTTSRTYLHKAPSCPVPRHNQDNCSGRKRKKIEKNSLHYLFLASTESLSHGAHPRMGVVTHDKNRARYRGQHCVFVAAIQNSRAITYQVNPHIRGFSGAKFFAAS